MNKLAMGMVVLGILVNSAGVLADQKCKNVDIKVDNQFGERIKVTKINYRDYEDKKWRDNDLKNTEIADGKSKTITETLEYVGNEKITKMQVQFQYETGHAWSNKVWSNVTKGLGGSTCAANKQYSIVVSAEDTKK
jgi:hypothetical protein